jgi:hypothetical protein
MGRSLWREDGSVVYFCCWPSPAQSFSGPSSVGLVIIFYCLRFETSLSFASYDSQGYGGGIRPCLHTGYVNIRVKVMLRPTVSRPPLSWCQASIWGLRPDIYFCQTVAGLLLWCALSDERTGLPFTIAAGPRQRSHSWIRVPRHSWPYFTVSDSRLPQPGRTGPRIYIPQEQGGPVIAPGTGFPFRLLLRLAGLRWRYSNPPPRGHVWVSSQVKVKVMLRLTVSWPPLSWCQASIWGLRPDLYYCWTVAGLLMWVALSDERTGLSFARLSQQY